MELFFEILLCSFAIFGLWCAMRLLAEALLGTRCITMAVTVRTQDELEGIATLLEKSRAMLSCRRGDAVAVLCDAALAQSGVLPPRLLSACRRYGAVCYVVNTEATGMEN